MPGTKEPEESRRAQILLAAYEVAASRGLGALTVRQVAAAADLSPGLVLFHFRTKEQLIMALLDWLLGTTTVLHMTADIAALASPLERLVALLEREMDRLSSEPHRIRLFFEYWIRGIHDRQVRRKMRAELARYRSAFRPIAAEVLAAHRDRFAGVTAAGLAAVAVSFIKGCAVQSMIDPDQFDITEYLTAAHALLDQLAPIAASS